MKCYRITGGWLAILVWMIAMAVSGVGRAEAAVLTLDAKGGRQDTAGYLERLDDPDGRLDAAQAANAAEWQALPGGLSAGFTQATVWLRLTVNVDSVRTGGWMLQLGNALLDNARVYVDLPAGGWAELGDSGEDVPRRDWPVDYRSPVFEFNPATARNHVILVRLQSKNALATRLDIWPRLAFDNQSRREGLLFGLYFGFYVLLMALHALFCWFTRAPLSGLFLAYISVGVANETLSLGLVQQVTRLPVQWSDPILGVGIAIGMMLGLEMSFRILALDTLYPRLVAWVRRSTGLLAAVCSVLILLGHYGLGMPPVQAAALLLMTMLSLMAVYLLWRGWRPVRFFILAFGGFYAGMLVGFLRNLGVLPVNQITEFVSTFSGMVHMLLLSLFIIGRHERQRRANERRQAHAAAEMAQEHSLRLEHEVALRTAELRNEILSRERLEDELRASLALERRVLSEQRDFVAMVSHEFRTPLAIITASSQQLERHLEGPLEKSRTRCGNIRGAAIRLLALVDEYLTDDRMSEPRADLRLQACDLHALLDELCGEFPPGRMRCTRGEGTRWLFCDAGLLRVALRNLLANADRHAPIDTCVDILMRCADQQLCIDVGNVGEFIEPAERDRMFQKYYRGQNAQHRPGAGLGLYLVQRIAKRLKGSVALTGAGGPEPVRFSLCLPR
ncbi:sensor histidine kinase [Comamonas sp. BIGb0124]|uniref:sensor histidine kinase n=1 Tax=Comamonas sp. BIGb0124 TaxID=2485130 RepID=UPI000F48B306|nr:sensor histidine kinase [Comamonas sp. BIGb0124]